MVIAGTPTATSGLITYTITTNTVCGKTASSEIKLEVLAEPAITLETNSGALTQTVCQNNDITPIKFKLSGAATGIDESLLPSFITITVDSATGIYTLIGAPVYTGTFNFKIKTIGNAACSAELDVSIENLYAAVNIVLDSATGTDNQKVCNISTPITPIVYNVTGNSLVPGDITVTGLPGGVTATSITTTTGLKLTISGTPTASGPYVYHFNYNNNGS